MINIARRVYELEAKVAELENTIKLVRRWTETNDVARYNKLGIPICYDNKMPLSYNIEYIFKYISTELQHINAIMGEIPLELRMSISGKIARSKMRSNNG